MTRLRNTKSETIEIRKILKGKLKGQHLLIIHDDPKEATLSLSPNGEVITGDLLPFTMEATHLLDAATAHWLRYQLNKLFPTYLKE